MGEDEYRRIAAWLLREEQRAEEAMRARKRPLEKRLRGLLAKFRSDGKIADKYHKKIKPE